MLRGWVGAVIQTGVSSKQAHPCTKQHLRRQNSPIIVGNTRDGRLRAILCVLERDKKFKVTWNDFFPQLCWILAQSLGVGQEHECNAVPSLSWILKTSPSFCQPIIIAKLLPPCSYMMLPYRAFPGFVTFLKASSPLMISFQLFNISSCFFPPVAETVTQSITDNMNIYKWYII